MGLRVKICGITQPSQGRAIAQRGADALGFICVSQSPRYVAPEQIARVVADLPRDPHTEHPICDRIGVFVDATPEMIQETVAIGNLTGIQLHGNESPEFCQMIHSLLPDLEIIKALRVKTPDALEAVERYESVVNTLLLDAYHPNQYGGTGKTLDWQALQTFRPTCPWFLAGGLTPVNVLNALSLLHPDGIDLSSGVEQAPGDKDLAAVDRLFTSLQR